MRFKNIIVQGQSRGVAEAKKCKVAAASVVVAENVKPLSRVVSPNEVRLDRGLRSDSSSDSEETVDIYCFLRYTVCLPCTACCFAFLGGG